MSKLSLNLTKISKNQPKLVIESFFVVVKKNGLVRRAWEEKRMDSNNIHMREDGGQGTYHSIWMMEKQGFVMDDVGRRIENGG